MGRYTFPPEGFDLSFLKEQIALDKNELIARLSVAIDEAEIFGEEARLHDLLYIKEVLERDHKKPKLTVIRGGKYARDK